LSNLSWIAPEFQPSVTGVGTGHSLRNDQGASMELHEAQHVVGGIFDKALRRLGAVLAFALLQASMAIAQTQPLDSTAKTVSDFPHALIPDLIADPSIAVIDGVFYCYATTDGYGGGLSASGPPVVWTSRDFLNWSFDGTLFAAGYDGKYWAPSTPVHRDGRYFLYPTLNGKITAVVADRPEGPFRAIDGTELGKGANPAPMSITIGKPIDADIFVNDDSQAYMVWAQRGIGRLKSDLVTFDGPQSTVPTKRDGYSEGPFLFKRAGVYYYLYTLGGNESYQYAYMMSRISPMGPWTAPEQDILSTTDRAQHIYGPGHGSVFRDPATDRWYFVYLEYGRGSTTRQVLADRLEFNPDGSIRPIQLTAAGVGALRSMSSERNLASGAKAYASSTLANYKVPTRSDRTLDRTETYLPGNAIDNSNGTRWMASPTDSDPWFMLDLGSVQRIVRTELYFVKPTAGHAYLLEYSKDGKRWRPYATQRELKLQSPHVDRKAVKARYLRVRVVQGVSGLWEFKVFG
jgi:Glycosyl hydrolases family 43/F5/8 type C domain